MNFKDYYTVLGVPKGLADSIDGSAICRFDHMLEDVLAQIRGEHPQTALIA